MTTSVHKTCARRWRKPDQRQGRSWRTHWKACAKDLRQGAAGARVVRRAVAHTSCARECNTKIANRIRSGDRTPRAVMRSVCLRRCKEQKVHAAPVAKPVVTRDVGAICGRYCSGGSHGPDCKAKCTSGQIGPGALIMRLEAKRSPAAAPFIRDAAYRLSKARSRMARKRRGMIRRAARRGAARSVRSFLFGGGRRKPLGRRR